jgi:hypothetical protein
MPVKKNLYPESLSPLDQYEKRKAEFLASWDGGKWDDFENLSDSIYVDQAVIGGLLNEGSLNLTDTSQNSQDYLNGMVTNIVSDTVWYAQLQSDLPTGKSIDQFVLENAMYMAQLNGKLSMI